MLAGIVGPARPPGKVSPKCVLTLGMVQALLPPLERPDFLFAPGRLPGSDVDILTQVASAAPYLLRLAASAQQVRRHVVIPSSDSTDGHSTSW